MLTRTVKRATAALAHPRTPSSRLHPFSSSSSSRLSPPSTPPSTAHLLTELDALLARYPLLDTAWNNRLKHALADLNNHRRARIAVVGDLASGAEGVVTALLDDPLASNPDVTVALEGRRLSADTPEAIAIKYGEESRSSATEVELPSNWLKETNAEMIEVVHGNGIPPLESSFTSLHLSDAVVLVLSDSTLLISKTAQTLLYNLDPKPNLFLALNTTNATPFAATSPLRTLQHQLESLAPASSSSASPHTLVVSTSQALAALEALNPSDPAQKPSYEAFSQGYLSSQIPTLSTLLTSAVSSHASSSPTLPTPLQTQTASHVLLTALNRAAFSGAQIDSSLSSASASLSALSQTAEESALALLTSLGVDHSTGLLPVPEDELASSLSAIEDVLMSRLSWYKLPYRVDDMHAEIALVVSSTYLPAFEDSLVYSAGRAQALTSTLSQRVDTLLRSTPLFSQSPTDSALSPSQKLASLYSATTLNRIAQAAQTASSGLSSTALSSAITHRRNQITSPGGPVDALHRRAQSAVVSSFTLAASSAGGATASQLLEWAELATNVGWGALGVTVGAWWLQSRWEKAKRRFRKDVKERVTGGVEEDLGVAARRLVDRSLYKTRTAVALYEELIRQRQRDFESFKAGLTAIEAQRRQIEQEGLVVEQEVMSTGKKQVKA
ncbi:hypothetical protein JCM11251_003678 [Rhodosporidiobolus azoricus]